MQLNLHGRQGMGAQRRCCPRPSAKPAQCSGTLGLPPLQGLPWAWLCLHGIGGDDTGDQDGDGGGTVGVMVHNGCNDG